MNNLTSGNKNIQLENFKANHEERTLTTNQGTPIANTDDSLKAGARGPL